MFEGGRAGLFQHEQAEPMVRLRRAALADIQRRGQVPRQDSSRRTHALDHSIAQSQIGFLSQVGRAAGQALVLTNLWLHIQIGFNYF